MKTLNFRELSPRGELSYRIIKNYVRLEGVEYRPEILFDQNYASWPADWEGRTLLSLALLARVTGRQPAFLDEILELLPEKLNEKGYIGKILPDNQADEQQLSGHNWLLRAILELYLWKKDEKYAEIAHTIVKKLYIPVLGMYSSYSLSEKYRKFDGKTAIGQVSALVDGWHLSSDIGCAYISLDGLSLYFDIFKDKKVGKLLDEMVDNFTKIDFKNSYMQTHASLSATRGIFRYYKSTGKKHLLEFVKNFFELYKEFALTENYENFNWFQVGTWTEACAVVDSYMIALDLFKETENVKYLDTATRIYHNAICFAQRENGGFGCDSCVGTKRGNKFLFSDPELYEAYWCCSMRGAEGLVTAATNTVLKDEKGIYVIQFNNGKYSFESATIEMTSTFPYEGDTRIKVTKIQKPFTLYLYLPEYVEKSGVSLCFSGEDSPFEFEDGFVKTTVKSLGFLEYSFKITLKQHDLISPSLKKDNTSFWHGPLILGTKEPEDSPVEMKTLKYSGKGVYKSSNIKLEPVNKSIYTGKEEFMKEKFRLIFKS